MSDGEEWKGEEEKPAGMYYMSMFGEPLTPEQLVARNAKQAERRAKGRMLAATLTRFKADAMCPKCGSLKARTSHCGGTSTGVCLDHAGDVEHMHRDCKRCHYTWYELPLDAG